MKKANFVKFTISLPWLILNTLCLIFVIIMDYIDSILMKGKLPSIFDKQVDKDTLKEIWQIIK